jgi:kynureninase
VQPENAYEISRELLSRNFVIDYCEGAGIRIAPHFYNSDEEIHQVMDAIATIIGDGSWQQHTRNRAFVT